MISLVEVVGGSDAYSSTGALGKTLQNVSPHTGTHPWQRKCNDGYTLTLLRDTRMALHI